MQTAAYPANRAPHATLKTLHNKEANLEHLRVIRAIVLVHIERCRKKLDSHAWEGRFVGYRSNGTFFTIYNPVTKRVVESRNVIFLKTPDVAPELGLEDEVNFSKSLFNYGDDSDLLRDGRGYTSHLDLNMLISLKLPPLLHRNWDWKMRPTSREASSTTPITTIYCEIFETTNRA